MNKIEKIEKLKSYKNIKDSIELAIEFGNWLASQERLGDNLGEDYGFSIQNSNGDIYDFKLTEDLFDDFINFLTDQE